MRYRTETDVDGLAGGEYPFLACSFWPSAYAAAGRSTTRTPLRPAVGLVNDVGLLSEEYDPGNGGWSATSAGVQPPDAVQAPSAR